MSNIGGVILAAGMGKRLGRKDTHKVLINLDGTTPLLNHLLGFTKLGIREVIVVVGYNHSLVEASAKRIVEKFKLPIDLTFTYNEHFSDRENGYSAYLGIKTAQAKHLFLVMGDHFLPYNHQVFRDTLHNREARDFIFGEIVDPYMEFMKPEWCTKLFVDNNLVIRSSKQLKKYNALDTGAFFFERNTTLKAVEELIEEGRYRWNDVVAKMVATFSVRAFEPERPFPWFGLNTEEEVKNAIKWLVIDEIKKFFPATSAETY